MPLIIIAPPPGIFSNGTLYQSKGRWCDANLVRFREGAVIPVPGWQKRSNASPFSGAARAVLSWRDNSRNRWIAVGTHSHLYVQDESGANQDITPTGFTVGRANASKNYGFGGGAFGRGYFGVRRPDTGQVLPASVWDLDNWGEDLVGCCDTDGKIYLWPLTGVAAVVTNAPAGCTGLLATQEGFLFALKGRRVAWCDQRNITLWAADATNQAGDYDLPTAGILICGRAVPGGALLFTDVDVWLASYTPDVLVYGFQRVGSGCGPISRGAVMTRDSTAAWMGKGGFWGFDGQSVQPLDCEVYDHVFGDLNTTQVSKISAVHLPDQGEIWWLYPSSGSLECDSYVAWGYRESARLGRNVWMVGKLGRLAGNGRGVFRNPLMVDAQGYLYEHETGLNYDSLVPYIETGPWEIGQGDFMAEVQRIVPDMSQDGAMGCICYARMWPNGPETTYGPFSLSSPSDMLFQATQIRFRFFGQGSGTWRLGNTRLDVMRGDPIESAAIVPIFIADFSNLDGPDVLA